VQDVGQDVVGEQPVGAAGTKLDLARAYP